MHKWFATPAGRRALVVLAEAGQRGMPLCAREVARSAGVSVRTVYRAAVRHLGGPPMRLLRLERLMQVRARLETAAPGDTVTRAAMDWGFAHLGRFAALYRRHFGEPPSETMRRARATGSRSSRIAPQGERCAPSGELPSSLTA